MTLHTTFYRGKRIFVQMHDGRLFVDKFIERRRAHVVLSDHGTVDICEIKSMTIARKRVQRRQP